MNFFVFGLTLLLISSLLISPALAFPHKEKSQIDKLRTGGYVTPGDSAQESGGPDQNSRTAQEEAASKMNPPVVSQSSDKVSQEKTETVIKPVRIGGPLDVEASKRNPVVVAGAKALWSNPTVQEAVVDKGMEVAGKLVDKQLQIIDEAQEKAANFLKKKIQLDITPDKAWENEDMFIPPGYHIDAAVEGEQPSPKEPGEVPYAFPGGLGGILMNKCWGSDYQPNDPCYNFKIKSTICANMIDGATFLGVGFDGRGTYSPDSRKMSIVQRYCANMATYGGFDVPDTMHVHGIYDTSASLVTFESREEYSTFLQQEAGVSGSFFGFFAGVNMAWGESKQSARQKYMAVLDVDVNRYEIFMNEVKPKDLSLSFLREFMDLPESYFAAGAPLKFQDFTQRWGTQYIKSSKFGGQLEIRKTMDAQDAKSKKEFEIEMEMEFKTLFASVGARASAKSGESSRKQSKTTSTSVVAHGGSQDIASILSDAYSPIFKTEFKEWLKTIPDYPKAFLFQMGPITDLLNFRANDLFPDEEVAWGCEGNAANLLTEVKDGKTVKYYEIVGADGNKNKYYCEFDSRQTLETSIRRRRTSLLRAIEIYMEEGPISISNSELAACTRSSDKEQDLPSDYGHPSWKAVTKSKSMFKVSFDMLKDLPSSVGNYLDIKRNASLYVRYAGKQWQTSDQNGKFHLYSSFSNGGSEDIHRKKMSIQGLVLTFNEADGSLALMPQDYRASKKYFPSLGEEMAGFKFARVQFAKSGQQAVKKQSSPADNPIAPCRVDWSNYLRLDPTDRNGKCLHFTASTAGTIFVVFAALPKDDSTWYYVEISPARAAMYKGKILKTKTTNVNARALGDASLYQSFFVCITETTKNTLIEYGKSLGTSDSGDVYLNMIDSEDHLNVRFYAFGNDEQAARVMDAHIVSRGLTKAECKGDTVRDQELQICVQNCHKDCDPLAGCKEVNNPAVPQGCHACRVALDSTSNECIAECPAHRTLTSEKKCVPTFDILLKPTENFGPLEMDNIPGPLAEVTISAWVRIKGSWGGSNANEVSLLHYERTQSGSSDYFQTYLMGSSINEGDIVFFFVVPYSGSRRLVFNELKDESWHQICVSWSGLSGVAIYYKDGKRVLSGKYTKQKLIGGGMLKLGGIAALRAKGNRQVTIHLTGVSLWKRVLSDQEIALNARKCDAGEGDEVPWHKWYDIAKAKTGFVRDTSQCTAPTPAAAPTPS